MKNEHESENFVFVGRCGHGAIYSTPTGYIYIPDEALKYKYTVVELPSEDLGKEICEKFCKMVEN